MPISTNIRGNTTTHQVFPPSYTDATGYQTRKLPVNTAQHFLNSAHASTQQGSTLKQHQPYIETTFYKRTPENSSIANPQLIQPQILGSKSAIFKENKPSTPSRSITVPLSRKPNHDNMEIDHKATNPEIEFKPTTKFDSTKQVTSKPQMTSFKPKNGKESPEACTLNTPKFNQPMELDGVDRDQKPRSCYGGPDSDLHARQAGRQNSWIRNGSRGTEGGRKQMELEERESAEGGTGGMRDSPSGSGRTEQKSWQVNAGNWRKKGEGRFEEKDDTGGYRGRQEEGLLEMSDQIGKQGKAQWQGGGREGESEGGRGEGGTQ